MPHQVWSRGECEQEHFSLLLRIEMEIVSTDEMLIPELLGFIKLRSGAQLIGFSTDRATTYTTSPPTRPTVKF